MFSFLSNYGEHSLFDRFDSLQREMDDVCGGWPPSGIRSGRAGAFPPIDVGVTLEDVHVYVYAPGMNAGDFEVSIQKDVLTVAGTRKLRDDGDATWYLRERAGGEFRRVLTLPEDVDPDKVEASYRDGVLHLRIQRRATIRPRRINIA